jgi:hypothetical protein
MASFYQTDDCQIGGLAPFANLCDYFAFFAVRCLFYRKKDAMSRQRNTQVKSSKQYLNKLAE